MIGPKKALSLVLANTPVLSPVEVCLAAAVDRTLARAVRARGDLPPFDASAMDGFAVRARDCRGAAPRSPVVLPLRRTLRAGAVAGTTLSVGDAVKVMTGAPLPRGADAVVIRETTEPEGAGRVRVFSAPAVGAHIRRRGEDVRRGSLLMKEGRRLRPYEIALLAAQGVSRVLVRRAPRIALIATGDELVDAAGRLRAGLVRDANGPALAAALSRWGAVPLRRGIQPDDPARLSRAFRSAIQKADALIVTGGVSAGDFDYTKRLLERLGLRTVFWQVAIKPGKPLLFGMLDGKPVFGLPGNPVAALVCLEEFVRPAVEKLQGHGPAHPSFHLWGRAANGYPGRRERHHYLFCRAQPAEGGYRIEIIRPQGSAMLGMACKANALAVRAAGAGRVAPGDVLAFRWLK